METGSRYIIYTLLYLGGISCLYFLCLFTGLPLFVSVILAAVLCWFLYRQVIPDNMPGAFDRKNTSWLALGLLTLGLGILTTNALNVAQKHGEWDAWAIWNYHARFLLSPEHWRNLFLNTENDHADYPLCLPAANAFFWRLTPATLHYIIPFVLAIFTTIATPVLIFTEIYKKHLLVATLALFLFAYNAFFIQIGVTQYSDSLLSLLLLAAMVCLDHAHEHKKYVAFAAALLGLCIWTKNEGAIVAGICTLFYANIFFSRRYWKMTLMGWALPALTWLLFRSCVLTPNDLIAGLGNDTWQKINTPVRYTMIREQFRYNLIDDFPYLKNAFYVYLIICLLRRKLPGKQMLMVCTCLIAYMLIYVVTKQDLQWHLFTSQNRLMLQMMAPMIYAMCMRFKDLRPKRVEMPMWTKPE